MRGVPRFGAVCRALALVIGLLSCAVEPPRAASSADLAGCVPGSYGVLGPDECWRDADCVVCRDGTACGTPVSRSRAADRGASCRILPDETLVCDASGVACCQHRCALLLGPPIFGRGTDDTSDLPRQ